MELPVDYNSIHWTERRKVREEYVKLQNGLCHYCGTPLSGPPSDEVQSKKITERLFPETFFKWPVHLHHCRNTGMTIGAVHNAVLKRAPLAHE